MNVMASNQFDESEMKHNQKQILTLNDHDLKRIDEKMLLTENLENQAVNNLLEIDNGLITSKQEKFDGQNDLSSWTNQNQIKPIFVYQQNKQNQVRKQTDNSRPLHLLRLSQSSYGKNRPNKQPTLFGNNSRTDQFIASSSISRINESEDKGTQKNCLNVKQILPDFVCSKRQFRSQLYSKNLYTNWKSQRTSVQLSPKKEQLFTFNQQQSEPGIQINQELLQKFKKFFNNQEQQSQAFQRYQSDNYYLHGSPIPSNNNFTQNKSNISSSNNSNYIHNANINCHTSSNNYNNVSNSNSNYNFETQIDLKNYLSQNGISRSDNKSNELRLHSQQSNGKIFSIKAIKQYQTAQKKSSSLNTSRTEQSSKYQYLKDLLSNPKPFRYIDHLQNQVVIVQPTTNTSKREVTRPDSAVMRRVQLMSENQQIERFSTPQKSLCQEQNHINNNCTNNVVITNDSIYNGSKVGKNIRSISVQQSYRKSPLQKKLSSENSHSYLTNLMNRNQQQLQCQLLMQQSICDIKQPSLNKSRSNPNCNQTNKLHRQIQNQNNANLKLLTQISQKNAMQYRIDKIITASQKHYQSNSRTCSTSQI